MRLLNMDLILRSRAQRGVSKDGQQQDWGRPFETHRFAMLLRVRRALLLLPIAAMAVAAPTWAQTRAAPAANLIDLNSASRDELMALDGIGEVRADAIIRARPFRAKTELVERRLIPEALYEKIADKVMARPPPGTPAPKPVPAQPKRS
jgi:competence protein ComEA